MQQLEKFIDSALIPYLLINKAKKGSFWKMMFLWSFAFALLTLAIAGPRWNFREIDTFAKDQSLVIVLDLSESMNAADVKPSRLARAKQKIEDLVNLSKGVKIGLIAFAADPHMITPLTEDMETIRHLLPTLDTGLVYVQGSKLAPALEMASTMLSAEPGSNKAVLVISDGGFEDASAIFTAKKLAEKGIVIHAMGLGTAEGAPIKDHEGKVIKKNGVPVISKLEKERFVEISKIGNGRYLDGRYEGDIILSDLEKQADAALKTPTINRIWDEGFYVFLFPAIPLFLWWFRRGAFFVLVLTLPGLSLHAEIGDYFKNSEQLGKQALDNGDYEKALSHFQDPYAKGVSYYRAGNFSEAEKMFQEAYLKDTGPSSGYNLGNALAKQQKLKEAIAAYEEVLKKWPEHTNAKENLELVKKMLEEEQKEPPPQNEPDKQKNQKQDKNSQEQDKDSKENAQKNENPSQEKEQQKEKDSRENEQQNENPSQEKENQQSETDSKENEQQKNTKPDQQENKHQEQPSEKTPPKQSAKTEQDQDADMLLNKIESDPKSFMKNKFYIESKKNGTREGIDPW